MFSVAAPFSKESMATLFIVVAVVLAILTARADRAALRVPVTVLAGFGAFALFAAGQHLLLLDCSLCNEHLAPKLAMLALLLWTGSAAWPKLLGGLPPSLPARAGRVIAAALALGMSLVLVELVFDAPMDRFIKGFPADHVIDIARYNRIVTALVLLAWPAAALLNRTGGGRLAVALLALSAVTATFGSSAAAQLMVLVAAIAYVATFWLPRAFPRLVAGGMIAVVASAPLLFGWLLPAAAPIYDRVPPSFADRLEIWDHTSRTIREGPWYGNGITSQRTLPLKTGGHTYRYHHQPATHPHDMALQAWVEFGYVGPVAAIGLILLTLGGVTGLDPARRQFAAATATAAAAVSLVGFGFWQETWLGMIGAALILIRIPVAGTSVAAKADPER